MKLAIVSALALSLLSVRAEAQVDPLFKVQNEVNLSLKFESEAEGKDIWKIPTYRGDCEDYALLKRKILIEKFGFSEDDVQLLLILRPVPGQKNVKEGHAVLYVKSRDMVLDSPSAEDERQNLKPIKLSDYTAEGNKVYCTFKDLSTTKQYAKVTDRCAPRS